MDKCRSWTPTLFSNPKISVDGAFSLKLGEAISGILLNDSGSWIFGFSRRYLTSSALLCETLVLCECCLLVSSIGLNECRFESDCAFLIACIQGKGAFHGRLRQLLRTLDFGFHR